MQVIFEHKFCSTLAEGVLAQTHHEIGRRFGINRAWYLEMWRDRIFKHSRLRHVDEVWTLLIAVARGRMFASHLGLLSLPRLPFA